jgi:hypothetical protein
MAKRKSLTELSKAFSPGMTKRQKIAQNKAYNKAYTKANPKSKIW